MLTRRDLDELARTTEDLLVSIYLRTHRRGTDALGDPIRLKNALNDAAARAAAAGADKRAVQEMLAPAHTLLTDPLYWQHQEDGLALFFGSKGLRQFHLLHPVEDEVLVGSRFCLRPILPAVSAGDRFFVLALSRNRVRLLQCSRTNATEIDLGDVPTSLKAAVGEDWKPSTLQYHSPTSRGRGARAPVTFHGQGAGIDDSKPELERFLRRVDEGVHQRVGRNGAPLVVAAVGYEAAAFRQVSRLAGMVSGHVEGNPDRLEAWELHARAWPLAAPVLDAARQKALAATNAGLHSAKVVIAVDRVLQEVHNKRVDTLLVRDTGPVWGTFDAASGRATSHPERQPADDDLLDLAVVTALRSGAQVHAVPPAQVPGGGPLAAMLRF